MKRALKIGITISIGFIIIAWLSFTPTGVFGKLDAVGYAVCHQIDVRSFFIGDLQFPICIRCTGMYLGTILGLIFLGIVNPRRGGIPRWYTWLVLGVFFLFFFIDGFNSFLSFFPDAPQAYPPLNFLRLSSGMGMGIFLAVILSLSFNQTAWKVYDRRPILDDWRYLLGLIVLALVFTGLVWIQVPFLMVIFAIIGTAGILVALTMVYTVIVIVIMRRDGRYQTFRQLLFPLLVGFGLTISQIFLLDFIRFILTGTWDGFHIG